MSTRRSLQIAVVVVLAAASACSRGPKAVAAGGPAPARMSPAPRSGLEVVGWMRRAHPSRELRSLAFTLTTTEYRTDSTVLRLARAYAALPGKLRVDQLPLAKRTAFVRDRARFAVFQRGRRVAAARRVDLATLLTYDVFAQNIDTTIMWLDSARVRFALLRRDRLDGRAVYVVGAADGDEVSPQFWVDAEHWRVLRVIQRDASANQLVDVRFTAYTSVLGVPVPTRIVTYRDGRMTQQQDVSHIAANPTLPARAFDLSRWRTVSAGS